MFKISNNVIILTRGDTLRVKITITDINGELYTPSPEDRILFGLKKSAADEELLIEKYVPTDTCELILKPEDTKPLEFGDYKYDLSITFKDGSVYTFITSSKFKITEEIG